MKKIFLIILLSMLLIYGSCKPKDDKNKYDQNKKIKITYYFEDDKTYDLVQKVSDISLPECIITNIDDINNNSKYDYLFEELNDELSSNEYMFYIDWYKDKQHTEQISNNINDDIILYGKISAAVTVDLNHENNSNELIINDYKYFYCDGNEELNLKSTYETIIFDSNVTDEPIIKKIRFGSNIESLTNESNKEKFSYLNVKKLIIDSDFFQDYQIDKNIINKYEFCENDKLEEIVINGNIDYINKYAFFKCHNLKRININGKVIELDYNLFYELPLLEEINITDVEIIQNSSFDRLPEEAIIKINNQIYSDETLYDPNKEITITYYIDSFNQYERKVMAKDVILPDLIGISDVNLDNQTLSKIDSNLKPKDFNYYEPMLLMVKWYENPDLTITAPAKFYSDITIYADIEMVVKMWVNGGVFFENLDYTDYVFYPSSVIDEFQVKPSYKTLFIDDNYRYCKGFEDISFYSSSFVDSTAIKSSTFYGIKIKKFVTDSEFFRGFSYIIDEIGYGYPNGSDIIILKSFAVACSDYLEELVINGDVDIIQHYSFYNMPNLKKIIINGHVGKIDRYAFRFLPSLESITIKTVGEIDKEAFIDLPENVEINIIS